MAKSASALVNPDRDDAARHNFVMGGPAAPNITHKGPEPYAVENLLGRLSLKTVRQGRGVWMTAMGRHHLDEGFGVVLNEGQPYSFVLTADEPVETFCAFFEPGFLDRVGFARRTSEVALLDADANRAAASSLEFPERVTSLEPRLTSALDRLYCVALADEIDLLSWEEAFSDLGFALLDARDGLATGLAVDRARPATRVELTRRLGRAIDFIHDNLGGQLGLRQIAGAAALSPHHFHRLFRRAMRRPVHVYVRELRLKRAARLLERTKLPVTEVCFSVGFSSLGSFSSLFTRAFGCAPSAWRSKAQDSRSGRPRAA